MCGAHRSGRAGGHRRRTGVPGPADQLRKLAQLDPTVSSAAPQRAEIAAELKSLCEHPLSDVRVRALPASHAGNTVDAAKGEITFHLAVDAAPTLNLQEVIGVEVRTPSSPK